MNKLKAGDVITHKHTKQQYRVHSVEEHSALLENLNKLGYGYKIYSSDLNQFIITTEAT